MVMGSLSNILVTGDIDKSSVCEMMHPKHIYSVFKEKKRGKKMKEARGQTAEARTTILQPVE